MDYTKVLINDSNIEPEIGRIYPLSKFNQIFFGNNNPFSIIGKMVLLNLDIIYKKDDEYYLILSRVNEYLELVKQKPDNVRFFPFSSYFPYNYYKYIDKENVSEYFQKMIVVIDGYLNYLDSIDDNFSKTIKYHLYHNGLLNCHSIEFRDNHEISIVFSKEDISYYIHFTDNDFIGANFLSLSNPTNPKQFESVYNYHKNRLLMATPEMFLVNNLERVTGDINFSKMIVKSYLCKNEFNTQIEGLTNLVLWKNEESKMEYVNHFNNKYPHLINTENGLMTNFEGFNKFLLNLDVKYLKQWEVKEQYNELYYQITHELIRSYELLYKNKI